MIQSRGASFTLLHGSRLYILYSFAFSLLAPTALLISISVSEELGNRTSRSCSRLQYCHGLFSLHDHSGSPNAFSAHAVCLEAADVPLATDYAILLSPFRSLRYVELSSHMKLDSVQICWVDTSLTIFNVLEERPNRTEVVLLEGLHNFNTFLGFDVLCRQVVE
jgi:hypothetical protein